MGGGLQRRDKGSCLEGRADRGQVWLSPSTSSTSLLSMKEAVYAMSGGPTQGKAGAFVLNYSDKKDSIPASQSTTHTSRGATAAQRGTWFALSLPWVKVAS